LQPLRRYTAEPGQALESLKYLTDGEKLFVITSDREKILDAIDREFVFSLDIGNLVRELNSSLRRAATVQSRPRAINRYVGNESGSA
jgi:hypothetical protein